MTNGGPLRRSRGIPLSEGLWNRRAAILVTLSVVASLLVIAGPARANNFSGASGITGCNGVNMQDNSTMDYYRSALTTKMYNAVAAR